MTKVFVLHENGERIEIKNGQFFSSGDKVLSYGEFTPPLTYDQHQVSKLSFAKFLVSNNLIILGFNVLTLPNEEFVELKLFSIPEPHPFPEFLNESLVNAYDVCFVHLFYKSANSPNSSYVSSISSPWNALYNAIDHELSLKGFPLFQIKVGIITSDATIPILENGNTFFSAPGSFAKGKQIMSIVASSDPELIVSFGKEKFSTSNLANIPKFIAHRVAILLRRTRDRNLLKYLRRILSLSIDNCLALDFLDMCEVTLSNTQSFQLKPEHFDRALLHLGNFDYFFPGNLINQHLNFTLTSYCSYVGPKSNEYTLCSSFWDPLVNILIRSGEPVHHRMEWEWESTKLYPNHPLRRVDLVCLAEFIGAHGKLVSIPFLQAESGKDFFTRERQHKDTTKLFGLMSANCITLAHELIAVGKKPELARAYGMLNGGIKTQLCVAVPIISEVGNNFFQIHTHISFPKHWELICFGNQEHEETNCTDVCCSSSLATDGELLFETIAKPETSRRFTPGPIDDDYGEFQVEPEDNEEESEVENFQNNPINYISLKKIATFILIVKEQLKRIYSAPTDESGRNFLPPTDRYYFSQSITIKKGQTGTTPSEVRVTESSRDEPRTPTRQISPPSQVDLFNMTKSSSKELQIYRKCSAYFPESFPRIYQVDETESGKIDYTFEKLLPLIENGRCSSLILSNSCSAMNNLISSIKFTINCLFNLHLLHEVIGVIHRDISPANIMYSKVDGKWKIIDYNLSIEKSESKSETSRIVGTRGYIAPESEASGIYSEATDVFSLGTVIFDIIYSDLLRQFMYESDEDEEDLPNELLEFEFVLSDMFDPSSLRISVEDALKKLLHLIKKILPKEHQIFKEELFYRIQNLRL